MTMEADTTTSTPTSEELGGRARSLANLRPPWRPGASGNPSGLTKDGRAPKTAKLEASLLAKLAKPGRMDRLAGAWIKAALKGSAPHLSMILERLYPVPQDATQGRQILEGLRLELSPGKATLTVARANGEPLCSAQNTESIEACPSDPALPALQLPEGQDNATADPAPQ